LIEEQFMILKFITEATGRIDTNELAQKIGITTKQLLEQVHDMTKTGFLKRVGGGYSITEKGKTALKATRPVSDDEKFQFYNGLDQPASISVSTPKEFVEAVIKAEITSIEFHTYREDFENWFRFAVKDTKFADELANIKKTEAKGEELRKAIVEAANNRYCL
jgi:predicted transcriptional regulator